MSITLKSLLLGGLVIFAAVSTWLLSSSTRIEQMNTDEPKKISSPSVSLNPVVNEAVDDHRLTFEENHATREVMETNVPVDVVANSAVAQELIDYKKQLFDAGMSSIEIEEIIRSDPARKLLKAGSLSRGD